MKNQITKSAEKKIMRQEMKEQRKRLDGEKREEHNRKAGRYALDFLKAWREKRNFSWLYGYMALEQEAETKQILAWCFQEGIRVAVPRVTGREMEFCEITSLSQCSPGAMGIREPEKSCPPLGQEDRKTASGCPVIVPGVAFGKDGSRLGYGGGYYDRFFEKEPEHLAVGLCYEFQVRPVLPAESHDRRMDVLITETGVRHLAEKTK